MNIRLFLMLLATCSLAVPCWAAPLDLEQVSANARWVAHVDADAFWASQTAKQFVEPLLRNEHAQSELKKFRSLTGFDPQQGLYSITLYGREYKPRSGVVIIRAEVDREPIKEFLAKQPDYKKTKYTGHTLYSWVDRHHGKHTVIACLDVQPKSAQSEPSASGDGSSGGESSLLVLAHRMADMRKALDVLDDRAPNLASVDSPLATIVQKTATAKPSVLTFSASGLAEADPFKSPVIRQCKAFHVSLGEDGSRLALHGRLVAKSSKSAGEMEKVLQGLLAMGRLAADTDENLNKILDAVKLSVDKRTVSFQWRGQVIDVVLAVQQQWMKKIQKHTKHKQSKRNKTIEK